MVLKMVRLIGIFIQRDANCSYEYLSRGRKARTGECLAVGHLLRKQITAISDAAIERHGNEIGAARAFTFSPRSYTRRELARGRTQNAHHPIIGSDNFQIRSVIALLRAQADKLYEPSKLVAVHFLPFDSHDFPDLLGKLRLAVRGNDRTRIGDEELQERCNGNYANKRGNHEC